jgi:hypothetical protein
MNPRTEGFSLCSLSGRDEREIIYLQATSFVSPEATVTVIG